MNPQDIIPAQEEQELREVFYKSKNKALDILGFTIKDKILKKKIESTLPDSITLKNLQNLYSDFIENKNIRNFLSYMIIIHQVTKGKNYNKDALIDMANQKLINEAEIISGNNFCQRESIAVIEKYLKLYHQR